EESAQGRERLRDLVLAWCTGYIQFAKCKSDFQWDRVIWSDETKIDFFDNKHQSWVWRRQKDSHTEKHLIPTVKYGGGSLMLWGCFSSKDPGHLVRMHGIMDSIEYQQILNENHSLITRSLEWRGLRLPSGVSIHTHTHRTHRHTYMCTVMTHTYTHSHYR